MARNGKTNNACPVYTLEESVLQNGAVATTISGLSTLHVELPIHSSQGNINLFETFYGTIKSPE